MGLSMQYFIIYTVLALARMTNQLTNNFRVGVQKILESACTTERWDGRHDLVEGQVRHHACALRRLHHCHHRGPHDIETVDPLPGPLRPFRCPHSGYEVQHVTKS